MVQQLVFLGAKAIPEIAELIRDINATKPTYQVVAALDDDPALQGTEIESVPITGSLDQVGSFPKAQFVFAIGSYRTRLKRLEVLERLSLPEERYATLIHPGAKIYSTAHVGTGSIVHFGAVLGNGARLGRWTIVLWNTVIGADNVLGDGVLVTSGVTTNANVKLGSYSFVGSGSAIADGVTVGPGAMVAMGSTVLRDVPDGAFQMGDPPRTLSREKVPASVLVSWERTTANG